MTRSSANVQKLAGPWLVDISSLRIKTCFLQRKDEPSCRKRLRKFRQTILREVFLLREETGEKVNSGDVVTRVKGLRDSSVQKRFQKKRVIDLCADFPLFRKLSTFHWKKVEHFLAIQLQYLLMRITMKLKMKMMFWQQRPLPSGQGNSHVRVEIVSWFWTIMKINFFWNDKYRRFHFIHVGRFPSFFVSCFVS